MKVTTKTLWGEESIPSKTCIKCHKTKPLFDFMTRENLKSGESSYRTECKQCSNDKANIRKILERENPRPIQQDYQCPICNKNEKELKANDRWNDRSVWCLDHNHLTLEFRGWICNNCNIAIGRLHDDPTIAYNAYKYLKAATDLL